jgi:exosortase/archaeosortase family protein
MLVIGCALLATYPRSASPRPFALIAVLPLALPLESTLQFALGYPMRRITAEAAALLLWPIGATAKGTTLFWSGRPLEVDAACSGVLGLWTFLILAAVLATIARSNWFATGVHLAIATVCALIYNALRSSLLFLNEFGLGDTSDLRHSLLGVAAFVLAAALLVYVATKLRPRGIPLIPARSSL